MVIFSQWALQSVDQRKGSYLGDINYMGEKSANIANIAINGECNVTPEGGGAAFLGLSEELQIHMLSSTKMPLVSWNSLMPWEGCLTSVTKDRRQEMKPRIDHSTFFDQPHSKHTCTLHWCPKDISIDYEKSTQLELQHWRIWCYLKATLPRVPSQLFSIMPRKWADSIRTRLRSLPDINHKTQTDNG